MKNYIAFVCSCLSFAFFVHSTTQAQGTSFELSDLGIERGRIAFTLVTDKGRDIYVLNFEDQTVKPIVASPKNDEYATWSPNGLKLAFHSDMSGDSEIYTVNADGSELTQLTNSKGADEEPDWSPESKQIVFSSARQGSGMKLYTMSADGLNQQSISSGKTKDMTPRWSPRGDELIFASTHWPGLDLALYTFKTKETMFLTDGLNDYSHPAWSPDGSRLAFCNGPYDDVDIWMQEKCKPETEENKGSCRPTQLTKLSGREYDPVWADDGESIFFVAEKNKGQSDYVLYLVDLQNKEPRLLLSGPGAIRYPSWTPFPAPPPKPRMNMPASSSIPTTSKGE